MKFRILFVLVAITMLCSSCHVLKTMGRYKVLATQAPADKVAVSTTPVKGEDCTFLADTIGWPSVQVAAENALAQAPGATGLKDARVEMMHTFFALGYKCAKVSGIPVK
ncbi:MAG: hypothetical protein JNM27_00205 [Leptospirales bacterium]|nr:hypothetical protein [Leptospirales bacterium]